MASTQEDTHGDLTSQVLHALDKTSPLLSSDAFPNQKSADVKAALDRLASRSMVTYETIDREDAILESEGQEIVANGSHEARVFEALKQAMDGLTIGELEKAVGDKNTVKVGQSRAFKSKWIAKGKEGRFVASVSWRGFCDSGTLADGGRPMRLRMRRESNSKLFKIPIRTQIIKLLRI
jgi:phenylalanyl-tRNA synthetase alpha chain